MTTDKPKKRKRRIRRTLGILLALLIIIIDQAWVQWDRHITIGHDTTRILTPIVDGYPDYLAATNQRHREGVTAENNAAPRLFVLVGFDDGQHTAWRKALYADWGVPEPTAPAPFRTYPEWRQAHVPTSTTSAPNAAPWQDDPLETESRDSATKPWSATDHPELAAWLKEMTPVLAEAEAASSLPKFYYPLLHPDGTTKAGAEYTPPLLPQLGRLRALAFALDSRAMLRLHEGDVIGMQADLLTCMRLARLLAQQPTMIEHLVALAIDSSAMQTVQHAAAEGLPAAAAGELRRAVETAGAMPTMAHAVDEGERYMVLEGTLAFRKTVPFSIVPINYNAGLRRVNDVYDRAVEAYNLPTAPAQRESLNRLHREVDDGLNHAGLQRAMRLDWMLLCVAFPSVVHVDDQQTLNLVERDLALTALALRQTKSRTGAFPDRLADLTTAGFAVPLDRFTDKPLVYMRKGDGFVLYSVGIDLKDDAGEPRPQTATGKGWDVVVKAEK